MVVTVNGSTNTSFLTTRFGYYARNRGGVITITNAQSNQVLRGVTLSDNRTTDGITMTTRSDGMEVLPHCSTFVVSILVFLSLFTHSFFTIGRTIRKN